jgi:hypothetical protein
MAQEVSLRPLTVEASFNPRPANFGFVVHNVVLGFITLRPKHVVDTVDTACTTFVNTVVFCLINTFYDFVVLKQAFLREFMFIL